MADALHLHLINSPAPDHLAYLHARLDPAVALTTGDDPAPQTTVLVSGRPKREQLAACPGLHALIIPFAGLPPETRALLADFPEVTVYNLHHNAPMTAEMAVALLLAAAKRIVPVDQRFRANDWTERYEGAPSVTLDGKTALILGYGAIGRRVGAVCAALGMRVIGMRRGSSSESFTEVYPPEKLRELLPLADALIICLPGTPETEGLIGVEALALLPRGALLVNVGRAAVVDEAALYTALRDGSLGAAGLDVWYQYPQSVEARTNTPPSRFPFAELDNVVLSPHRAGGGGADEVERRRMDALAETVNALAEGDTAPGRVDVMRGY